MRIAVIDDEPADRETIAALVSCWAKDQAETAVPIPFPSAEAFLFAYSEDKNFGSRWRSGSGRKAAPRRSSSSPPISSWRARATRWPRFIISSNLYRRKSSPPY